MFIARTEGLGYKENITGLSDSTICRVCDTEDGVVEKYTFAECVKISNTIQRINIIDEAEKGIWVNPFKSALHDTVTIRRTCIDCGTDRLYLTAGSIRSRLSEEDYDNEYEAILNLSNGSVQVQQRALNQYYIGVRDTNTEMLWEVVADAVTSPLKMDFVWMEKLYNGIYRFVLHVWTNVTGVGSFEIFLNIIYIYGRLYVDRGEVFGMRGHKLKNYGKIIEHKNTLPADLKAKLSLMKVLD